MPVSERDRLGAKLAVVPVAASQRALASTEVDRDDPNALRTATVGDLRTQDAELAVMVRPCTDLDSMPVEVASEEWPEDESPDRTVARLRLLKQDAFSPARQAVVDNPSFLRLAQPRGAPAAGLDRAGAAAGLSRDVPLAPGGQRRTVARTGVPRRDAGLRRPRTRLASYRAPSRPLVCFRRIGAISQRY